MTEQPFVSCIMPTCNRRRFVPHAVEFFLRQDYPNRELIVVDDGTDSVEDLVPDDPRIHYFGLPRKQSIGAKRNLACEKARGELIAHWDDDDWIAPWRLSYQVADLLSEGADLCGLDQLVFFDPIEGAAWKYVYPKGDRPWVAGGTMCYHKRLWDQRRFESISNGEDTRYVWGLRDCRVLRLANSGFYAALIHAENTVSKRRKSDRWRPHPIEDVRRQMGDDWRMYDRGAAGEQNAMSTDVKSSRPPARQTGFDELLQRPELSWDGWSISQSLGRELDRRLAELQPKRILEVGSGTSTAVLARYAKCSGAHFLSLEHDPKFFAATKQRLGALGLENHAQVRLAPLKPIEVSAAGNRRFTTPFSWYQTELGGTYDFVFVDGPPLSCGRQAVMFALSKHLAERWELWLKDGFRDHERECVSLWSEHFALSQTLTSIDPRGVWHLAPGPPTKSGRKSANRTPVYHDRSKMPLVSCIMVTSGRPQFARQAVQYFLRQDYPNKELIVVDDGVGPEQSFAAHEPAVHYHRCNGKRTTGEKRNLACRLAHGEIIACWDDDDWFAPDRLTYQVRPLLTGEADGTGITHSLLYTVSDGLFWRYSPEISRRMFFNDLLCGTLVFWARHWGKVKYPNVSMAEDVAFVRRLTNRGVRIKPMPSDGRFVYVRHGDNTWQFAAGRVLDAAGWQRVPAPCFISQADIQFYSDLRGTHTMLKEALR